MKSVYRLIHKNIIEIDKRTGKEICDVKLLGFFSSKEKCKEAIKYYLKKPGFKDYPNRFFYDVINANIDDYNAVVGKFDKYVYYLSHEWYDGEYDFESDLGFYSTKKKANLAEKKYRLEAEYLEHQDGFYIGKYKINEMNWKEGFLAWEELDD